jgi:hypothetical protein
LILLVMVFLSSFTTASESQYLPRNEVDLGFTTASASSTGLDNPTGSQSFHDGVERNQKEPILHDPLFALEASSTSRIMNPSSIFNQHIVVDDIPCPSSCDAMCESHVNQFIRHLMDITTLDKVRLQEEIAAAIHLQRQKQYVPEEDEAREVESTPSISSLSSLEADSQSSTIPVKEDEEKGRGKERPTSGGQGDFYNITSLIPSTSYSRYHERRLLDVTTIAWSLISSSASWSGRSFHSSVALDSNTIVLMGGVTSSSIYSFSK